YDVQRQLFGDHTLTDGKNIGVVMLSRQPGGLLTPAKRATHAMHLIRDHRFTVARAAEDNTAVAFAVSHCFRSWPNENRIVHRFFAVRAEIFHLLPQRGEQFFHLFLVMKTGVIRAEGNFHKSVIPSEVEESLILNPVAPIRKTISRDVSTKPVLSGVEGLDMTMVIYPPCNFANSLQISRSRSVSFFGTLIC